MLGIYIAALLFGGILIGASLILGGHDADASNGPEHDLDHAVDHETDHDFDGGADHEAEHDHATPDAPLWLPFLSMRFWTFFAAATGLTGVLLTLLGMPSLLTAGIAFPLGAALGTAAAWFFRQLKRSEVTGDLSLERLIGQEARVVLPVRPGELGKIAIFTLTDRIELMARTRDARAMDVGTTVLIANIDRGVADVTSLPGPRMQHQGQTVES